MQQAIYIKHNRIAMCLSYYMWSISTEENFPWTENFPKISLLKVENFQLQNFFSDGKFVSANQIVQNFLSVENFPEWEWAFTPEDFTCEGELARS